MKPRHLILIGLPGAGKTAVGRLIAQDLDRPFVDVDALIEETAGMSVGRIFADQGEAAFRRFESRSMSELLARHDAQVIAPGGGWAAQPEALASVAGRALTVYLETSPETAAARTDGSGTRPLVDAQPGGREERMRELFRERERCYAGCDIRVGTDGKTPREVARRVIELARMSEGC